VVVNASQNEKLVDSRRVKFIESSHTLLSTWGFQYFNIQKSEQVIEMSLLKFHKLPLVENEALSVDDFIEFMEYSEHHIQLPDHLKAPPAVQRILASKSCRTAVKFGDTLTMKQCSNLLGDVVQCANPFQCAHGRPSIVPLISLSNPKKQNARKRLLLNGRAKHLK
jgi:DNA mismatch repair ATPase MutL